MTISSKEKEEQNMNAPKGSPIRKEKTKRLITGLIICVMGIVFAILGLLVFRPTGIMIAEIFAYMVGGLIVIIGIIKMCTSLSVGDTYCKECGDKYVYGRDVVWSVIDVTNFDDREETEVAIECTCNKCGKKHTYVSRYKTGVVDKYYNFRRTDISILVKKDFM